ncbi:ribonuclease HII [Wallemia mellicola CBS 633.66]|uniref:Ribonuclease n=2 Tax=Wallemia mellicola TaxID=1708541 RepID=A0A4V4MP15_9BASI|nr:ribonuclease HII [Wallemia mellicola CBS 633.66]TIC01797.1 ribonuclease HII [Wallemia mellicola]EIM21266.1 ribonuclease HII [Wallemia mellicola CBS 633.66]TIC07063.1 ribonuclease HII [Wallemia mellicola]TIC25934.1 ribonuclease HII [Wallemia mellicola]TIC33380.1 ribonuclease HII [Wallemia mellicola]|eukprot:XP_006958619.1 ribonuclease HII [Wallemia mellicola CBS 633.66]
MVKRTRKDSKLDDDEEVHALPPSMNAGEPLVSSYSYHSDVPETLLNNKVMMGVDEAGRGPVLGPLVYGIAYCNLDYEDTLKDVGFADSKALTAESRQTLLDKLISLSDQLAWSVRVMSPQDISAGMLKKVPYNLNAQSHDATFSLINDVIAKGVQLEHVYVDTVGPAKSYQAKLEAAFPSIGFTVASKADSLFPIVSAASIAAKVTRDAIIDNWSFLEPISNAISSSKKLKNEDSSVDVSEQQPEKMKLGSGYPGDPNTVAWLKNNLDDVFGLPQLARFSWSTVKNLLESNAHQVTWMDEDENVYKSQLSDAPPSLKKLGVQPISSL